MILICYKCKISCKFNKFAYNVNDIRNEINLFVHDAKQQRRLELCTEEILVNIIEYAYPNTVGALYISVEYIMEIKQLRFTFYDEGIPYNPLLELSEHNKITSLEEQPIGGLGIFYILQLWMVLNISI